MDIHELPLMFIAQKYSKIVRTKNLIKTRYTVYGIRYTVEFKPA